MNKKEEQEEFSLSLKCSIIAFTFILYTGLFVLFKYYLDPRFIIEPKLKNEIVYVLPVILEDVNKVAKHQNKSNKNNILRELLLVYNYKINKKGDLLNDNRMKIEMENQSIISFYNKDNIKNIEKDFNRINSNKMKIKITCMDEICKVSITEIDGGE